MSIHVRIGVDLGEARELIRHMADGLIELDDRDLLDIANLALRRIHTRTKRGLDASGSPFAAYKPRTLRSRKMM